MVRGWYGLACAWVYFRTADGYLSVGRSGLIAKIAARCPAFLTEPPSGLKSPTPGMPTPVVGVEDDHLQTLRDYRDRSALALGLVAGQ